MRRRFAAVAALLALPLFAAAGRGEVTSPLPGGVTPPLLPDTKPLNDEGDLAAKMVEGVGKHLDRETTASVEKRKALWNVDFSSLDAYLKSVQPNRDRLKKILGVVEERVPFTDLEYVGGPKTPPLVAETDDYKVFAVRWPVLPGVDAEGLLLAPKKPTDYAAVAVPDAGWTPEMIVGLAPGVPKEGQYARRLAECGYRVLVPAIIDRKDTWSGNPALGRMTNQPHREFLYRMGYEVGRHPIGCEVQKVLAAVDWFEGTGANRVAVYGYGEGGRLALYAGALDERIRSTVVEGAFGAAHEETWRVSRSTATRLRPGLHLPRVRRRGAGGVPVPAGAADAGGPADARAGIVKNLPAPTWDGPPAVAAGRSGAAPGRLAPQDADAVTAELARARKLVDGKPAETGMIVTGAGKDVQWFAHEDDILNGLNSAKVRPPGPLPTDLRKDFHPEEREHRQFDQLVNYMQRVLRESERGRDASFWAKLDTSSVEKYEASTKPFRRQLDEDVLGKLPDPTVPLEPAGRGLLYDEPKYRAYEVTLDIYPDVFAYGILALPKDLKPGEKRPVVVCQHGLEGRPTDVINPKEDSKYYHSFGSRLAELGYIV